MARVTISPTKRPIRRIPVGGRLQVSRLEAKTLVVLGLARVVPDTPPPPVPVPVQAEQRSRRQYKRRDMQAEE